MLSELLEAPLVFFYVCVGTAGALLLFCVAMFIVVGLPMALFSYLLERAADRLEFIRGVWRGAEGEIAARERNEDSGG